VDELIGDAADGIDVHEYNEAGHYVDFEHKTPKNIQNSHGNLSGFLSIFDTNDPKKAFLILKDIHHYFKNGDPRYNPEVIARIKSIAQRTMFRDDVYTTIFLVCSELVIPPELEKMITVFDIPLPDNAEIERVITDYAHDFQIPLTDDVLNELIVSFKGLSDFEIRQILNLAYQQSGTIDAKDKALILKEKEQIIKKSGILEILPVNSNMDDVGGLVNLKKYLRDKSSIFNNLGEARKFGIDLPKGILIVGMPGCGKSLTAKATAAQFNVPLLRLDIGKLMGKYVGESEGNLRRAIKTAEAVAPCVLWIDELEKAFAGIGGQGGGSDITTRLFGQFLTWLQEKESSVYVVATSNDISQLPPEFLRKGRFDELFLVELPDDEERRKIFEIHLRKRGKLTKDVDVLRLLKDTKGYSGADIESLVKETIETAFVSSDKSVTTEKLSQIIKSTKSISVTLKEKIENLKKSHEKYDFKKANE
jgi:SpoVK/Ycf46/Vps4 family AAA+-type ATPase